MSDDLYERDILAWSERQAELLRCVADGERVNDVDWPHVVEEIADVGISELNAVRSHLRQTMIHLLKCHLWPDDPAQPHWRLELGTFQDNTATRIAPFMRQPIELQAIYDKARARIERTVPDHPRLRAVPSACPWSLDQLLDGDPDILLAALPPLAR